MCFITSPFLYTKLKIWLKNTGTFDGGEETPFKFFFFKYKVEACLQVNYNWVLQIMKGHIVSFPVLKRPKAILQI